MDGLRYSPDDPYYRLGPVHTCLYVRVRETGDWDIFLGFIHPRVLGIPTISFQLKLYSQTYIFAFQSNSEKTHFLTHAHTLSESSCTTVRKNTYAACHLAAAYTTDCGTTCPLNACVKHKVAHFRRRRPAPDGGDAVVSTRLSRAAASIYLER